jgi:hypothetical protein
VDPDLPETGQPYAFTNDDPLNLTDPLGLVPGKYYWNNTTWNTYQGTKYTYLCVGSQIHCGGPSCHGGPCYPSAPSVNWAALPTYAAAVDHWDNEVNAAGAAFRAAEAQEATQAALVKDYETGTEPYQYSGTCISLIVQHCTYTTADGNTYSSWGVSEQAGVNKVYRYIVNNNLSTVTNNCAIDNFVHGWSLSGGGSVGPIGGSVVWGNLTSPGSTGSAGYQVEPGASVGFGGTLSYAFGKSC